MLRSRINVTSKRHLSPWGVPGERRVEPIAITVGGVVGLGALWLAINHARNRSFTNEVPVFRASRWTKGNRIWPTQVSVFPNRVVRWTPRLFGHFEETRRDQ